jgi:hypothetical protein
VLLEIEDGARHYPTSGSPAKGPEVIRLLWKSGVLIEALSDAVAIVWAR